MLQAPNQAGPEDRAGVERPLCPHPHDHLETTARNQIPYQFIVRGIRFTPIEKKTGVGPRWTDACLIQEPIIGRASHAARRRRSRPVMPKLRSVSVAGSGTTGSKVSTNVGLVSGSPPNSLVRKNTKLPFPEP